MKTEIAITLLLLVGCAPPLPPDPSPLPPAPLSPKSAVTTPKTEQPADTEEEVEEQETADTGSTGDTGDTGDTGSAAAAPAIVTQPADTTVDEGATATFSVQATGALITYQWHRDGSAIAGATNAEYELQNAQLADYGAELSVEVSNSNGTVTSAVAKLIVQTDPWLEKHYGECSGRGIRDGNAPLFTGNNTVIPGSDAMYVTEKIGALKYLIHRVSGSSTLITGEVPATLTPFYASTAQSILATDGAGVLAVTPQGVATRTCGQSTTSLSVLDGACASARFLGILAATADAAGNVYVNDGNHTVRKISQGQVTTVATVAAEHRNKLTKAIAVDGAGNVFLIAKHAILIFSASGGLTVVGNVDQSGTADGTGSLARFTDPRSLAYDAGSNTVIVSEASDAFRRVTATGSASKITVTGYVGFAPWSMVASGGSFYFPASPIIQRVDAAGNATVGAGSYDSALQRVAFGRDGRFVYAEKTANGKLKLSVIDTAGSAQVAGVVTDADTIALDAAGRVYFDWGTQLHRLENGVDTFFAGSSFGTKDGVGPSAQFESMRNMKLDRSGNIWLADSYRIRKVTPQAAVSTLATLSGQPVDLVPDDEGGVFAATNTTVYRIDSAGVISELVKGLWPNNLAYDATTRSLYVAGGWNGTTIDKVLLDGTVSRVVGVADYPLYVAAGPLPSTIIYPRAISFHRGKLYIESGGAIFTAKGL